MAPPTRPALDRFFEKVKMLDNGCWLWTGGKFQTTGYGRFYVDGKVYVAHRWGYEQLVRPLRKGVTLDHVCHTTDPDCNLGTRCPHRLCVRPAHLEPMSLKRNILRGKGHAAKNAKRTHCRQGHPLEGENLYVGPDGKRSCRICMRARDARKKARPATKAREQQRVQGEKRKAYVRAYNVAHRDELLAYHKTYYRENKERELANRRARRG